MIDFIHLHVHTTYSFLDGYGTPKQYLDRLEEIGHSSFAITDHGNIWGHIPFEKEAKARNKNVIFGCEFYVAPANALERDTRTRFHITVMARNQAGLTNLHRLISFSNLQGFYYKPRIDFETLLKHKEGLIVLSGCMGDGVVMRNLDNPDMLDWYLKTFKKELGGNFYIEVSPIDTPEFVPRIKRIMDLGPEYGIKVVSTSDTHFPRAEDHTGEDLSLCVGLKCRHDDPSRMMLMKSLYMFDGHEAAQRGKMYGTHADEYFNN